MNRVEYLSKLKSLLHNLPQGELDDILSDYHEHFEIGLSKGKTEAEISKELGDPLEIARNYGFTEEDNKSYNTNNDNGLRRFIIAALLIMFNLTFVVGPAFGLAGFLIGAFILAISFGFIGIALILGSPFIFLSANLGIHIIVSISFGIGFIGLGILSTIFLIFITKKIVQLVAKYINWNIDLINK